MLGLENRIILNELIVATCSMHNDALNLRGE